MNETELESLKKDITELKDREAIKEVIYRYCRAVDRLDMKMLRSVYHDDATQRHPDFYGSPDDFVKYVEHNLKALWRSQHSISNLSIELDGDKAYVECYARALHLGHIDPPPDSHFPAGWVNVGYYRYIDILQKREGVWKILDRTLALTSQWDFKDVQQWPEEPHYNTDQRAPDDLVYNWERLADTFVKPPANHEEILQKKIDG